MVKYDSIANEFVSEEGTKWTGSRIDDHIILINRKSKRECNEIVEDDCKERKMTEQKTCETCRHYGEEWDSPKCRDCSIHHGYRYERQRKLKQKLKTQI